MKNLTNPTEIARETLKELTTRRIKPTPDNYQKIYFEIAGTSPEKGGPDVGGALMRALEAMGRKSLAQKRTVQALQTAIEEGELEVFERDLTALLAGRDGDGAESWSEVLRELLKQWERKHSGISTIRKREGLERVLINFASDSSVLRTKLQALAKSWGEAPAQAGIEGLEPVEGSELGELPAETSKRERGAAPSEGGATVAGDDLQTQLKDLVAQCLELGVIPRLTQFPDLVDEADQLAKRARDARDHLALQGLSKDLKQFWFKLELRGETDADVLAGLLRLLRMLVENISELVADDQWVHGQVAVIQEIISHPMNTRTIFEAERSFKEVVFKQGTLKQSLNEAKAALKNLIATFIDRLGQVSESTGEYHMKIERYSKQISQTEDIHQINKIVGGLLEDTRGMQLDMLRSRDELIETRKRVEQAEQRIHQLETELEEVSEKVREDQLTGSLNRRGLEDAFERELARTERVSTPLSVAVLDVDNFKRLNDTYGHQAGDEALIHLVRVTKEALRPTDIIARYGGEEFVILLPDTAVDEAVKVMQRVQRELTRNFFLRDNQKLLITFSAGVAMRKPGETAESMIARADEAVYEAKSAGKNRVIAAPA
jgi:diguanylate cyclase